MKAFEQAIRKAQQEKKSIAKLRKLPEIFKNLLFEHYRQRCIEGLKSGTENRDFLIAAEEFKVIAYALEGNDWGFIEQAEAYIQQWESFKPVLTYLAPQSKFNIQS